MNKIYSRKRFKLNIKKNKLSRIKLNKSKIIKIIIIFIAFHTFKNVLEYVNPIYEKICLDEAKNLATIITNEQASIVMKNYDYDDMFSIEKDFNGNIAMIKTNIVPINSIISEIVNLSKKELENEIKKRNVIKIPIGSFSGLELLNGSGPKISIKFILLGNLDTDLKSEFISQGINQTLHRVYLKIDCNMKVASSYKNLDAIIHNQILLVENVIVGQIPNTYLNVDDKNIMNKLNN